MKSKNEVIYGVSFRTKGPKESEILGEARWIFKKIRIVLFSQDKLKWMIGKLPFEDDPLLQNFLNGFDTSNHLKITIFEIDAAAPQKGSFMGSGIN